MVLCVKINISAFYGRLNKVYVVILNLSKILKYIIPLFFIIQYKITVAI